MLTLSLRWVRSFASSHSISSSAPEITRFAYPVQSLVKTKSQATQSILKLAGCVGLAYLPPVVAGIRFKTPNLGHLRAVPGERAVHRVVVRSHVVPVSPMAASGLFQSVEYLKALNKFDSLVKSHGRGYWK